MEQPMKGQVASCRECGSSFVVQREGHAYCTGKCRQAKHNRLIAELYRNRKRLAPKQ